MTISISGNGPIAGSDRAAAGANNDITSLGSLTSVNGGQLAGFRNRIINGGCQVSQYGTKSIVNNVWQYGGCDRITVGISSFTTISGNISQIQLPGTATGYQQSATGVTTTGSGAIQFGEKIEAVNCSDLNGKQVTISGKLYQDTGSSITCSFTMYKTATMNTWTAPTIVQTVSLGSIPSGVMTPFSVTITLGASDATNGLWPLVTFPVGAVTEKTFTISDFQLEEGSIKTPFEQRQVGIELVLCQRYYELGGNTKICVVDNGTGVVIPVPFKVTKRAIPTITNSGVGTTTDINTQSFSKYMIAAGTVDTGYFVWEASAEL